MRINNLVDITARNSNFEKESSILSILLWFVRRSVKFSVVCDGRRQGCWWSFLTDESSVSNDSKSPPAVSSVEGAGGVVDSGDGGAEGLGLGGGPVLALVRLGHLSGSTVHGGSMDGGMDHRSGVDGGWS